MAEFYKNTNIRLAMITEQIKALTHSLLQLMRFSSSLFFLEPEWKIQ